MRPSNVRAPIVDPAIPESPSGDREPTHRDYFQKAGRAFFRKTVRWGVQAASGRPALL
jgi:hypothetical protein